MTFDQVLPAMKQGQRVTRKSNVFSDWIAEDGHIFSISKRDGYKAISALSPDDILADDWEFVE